MTFEEDLTKRRIDVAAFATGEPDRFAEWREMYAQMHPNSFYISVKMVLNDVRRKFWLAEAVKPAAVAADVPAKPVVRRAAIPGAAKPTVPANSGSADPTNQPENKSAPTAPARGRAVIRKPATASPEATSAPETTPPVTPAVPPEAPPTTPAPRPRPVFRKPTAAVPPEEPTANQEQIAEDKTNHATSFHTNPDPETEVPAPKPPRPRPVIKRPVAKAETGAENAASVPPIETEQESDKLTKEPVAATEPVNEPVKATPPRPRPVMRRPNPPAPDEVLSMPAAAEQPAGEESAGETAAEAKPPRPRPVFKRPAKPADNQEQ